MFAKFFSAIKKGLSSKEVTDRAELVEDVLFGKTSGSDSEAVLAIAQLTKSLCNNKTAAAVDAGLYVFFKIKTESGDFQIFHKRLTVRERAVINHKPTLLTDPYRLLENLENAIALSHERAEELRRIAHDDGN